MKGTELVRLAETAAQSKYWREEDAAQVLRALATSGQSLSAFCNRFGINEGRLRRWQRRLFSETGEPAPVGFHPVQVLLHEEVGEGELVLVLRNGRRVVVPRGFDEATLARLARVAESGAC